MTRPQIMPENKENHLQNTYSSPQNVLLITLTFCGIKYPIFLIKFWLAYYLEVLYVFCYSLFQNKFNVTFILKDMCMPMLQLSLLLFILYVAVMVIMMLIIRNHQWSDQDACHEAFPTENAYHTEMNEMIHIRIIILF